jgi:hypothetical protein
VRVYYIFNVNMSEKRATVTSLKKPLTARGGSQHNTSTTSTAPVDVYRKRTYICVYDLHTEH